MKKDEEEEGVYLHIIENLSEEALKTLQEELKDVSGVEKRLKETEYINPHPYWRGADDWTSFMNTPMVDRNGHIVNYYQCRFENLAFHSHRKKERFHIDTLLYQRSHPSLDFRDLQDKRKYVLAKEYQRDHHSLDLSNDEQYQRYSEELGKLDKENYGLLDVLDCLLKNHRQKNWRTKTRYEEIYSINDAVWFLTTDLSDNVLKKYGIVKDKNGLYYDNDFSALRKRWQEFCENYCGLYGFNLDFGADSSKTNRPHFHTVSEKVPFGSHLTGRVSNLEALEKLVSEWFGGECYIYVEHGANEDDSLCLSKYVNKFNSDILSKHSTKKSVKDTRMCYSSRFGLTKKLRKEVSKMNIDDYVVRGSDSITMLLTLSCSYHYLSGSEKKRNKCFRFLVQWSPKESDEIQKMCKIDPTVAKYEIYGAKYSDYYISVDLLEAINDFIDLVSDRDNIKIDKVNDIFLGSIKNCSLSDLDKLDIISAGSYRQNDKYA